MNKSKNENLVQFIKFGVVGVVNTGVDWVVYYLLTASVLEGDKSIAKAISFLVAVANSYLFNTIWTFKKEYQKIAQSGEANAKSMILVKFFVVSLIGWGINWLVFRATLGSYNPVLMGKHDIMPLVFASGSAIIWNFFINKLWTYKR
ncbi:MAG: GtrA family protein [Patescibacteria group bacterium]|jgi:putative flippase GtrA